MTRTQPTIPRTLKATFTAGAVTIHAKAGAVPRFSLLAYAGGAMQAHVTPPLPFPIVVDLAGVTARKGQLPILRDHQPARVWAFNGAA
jgi:hypothetical protein